MVKTTIAISCNETIDYMQLIESEIMNINLNKSNYTLEQIIFFRSRQKELLKKWNNLHDRLCVAYDRNLIFYPKKIKEVKDWII